MVKPGSAFALLLREDGPVAEGCHWPAGDGRQETSGNTCDLWAPRTEGTSSHSQGSEDMWLWPAQGPPATDSSVTQVLVTVLIQNRTLEALAALGSPET